MRTRFQVLFWLGCFLWAFVYKGHSAEIRIPATCIDVFDGDTFTVELSPTVTISAATVDGKKLNGLRVPFRVNVRLIDLTTPGEVRGVWAPERTKQEPGWQASRESLERMVLNKRGTLIIDTAKAVNANGRYEHTQNNASNLFTMGRILGDFHVQPYRTTVGRRQVNSGNAFPAKDDQEALK